MVGDDEGELCSILEGSTEYGDAMGMHQHFRCCSSMPKKEADRVQMGHSEKNLTIESTIVALVRSDIIIITTFEYVCWFKTFDSRPHRINDSYARINIYILELKKYRIKILY